MSLECLGSLDQVRAARMELKNRRLGYERSMAARFSGILRRTARVRIGDWLKSWDVLRTASFLEDYVSKDDAVLDLGAFESEILLTLTRLGFTDLHGIDLDPRVTSMASLVNADLRVGDFYATDYGKGLFSAVTAISVIEHGYRGAELFREVSRLLRPGGYFLASFDYWPEKLDTSGIELFGMTWTIFSEAEVMAMLAAARQFGLRPVGEIDLRADLPAIHWGGKAYTFAWMALKKDLESASLGKIPLPATNPQGHPRARDSDASMTGRGGGGPRSAQCGRSRKGRGVQRWFSTRARCGQRSFAASSMRTGS